MFFHRIAVKGADTEGKDPAVQNQPHVHFVGGVDVQKDLFPSPAEFGAFGGLLSFFVEDPMLDHFVRDDGDGGFGNAYFSGNIDAGGGAAAAKQTDHLHSVLPFQVQLADTGDGQWNPSFRENKILYLSL